MRQTSSRKATSIRGKRYLRAIAEAHTEVYYSVLLVLSLRIIWCNTIKIQSEAVILFVDTIFFSKKSNLCQHSYFLDAMP